MLQLRLMTVVLLFSLCVLAGCGETADPSAPEGKPVAQTKVATDGETAVTTVSPEDAALSAATETARDNVGILIKALKNPAPGMEGFTVKKEFLAPSGGGSRIWLDDISYDGVSFHGKVGSTPDNVPGVKKGDEATIDAHEIMDWMYFQKDKMYGGYTVKVMYARETPEGKKQIRKTMGLSDAVLSGKM
jgi:uncharacterized protein YegJ (DUF2314 family)